MSNPEEMIPRYEVNQLPTLTVMRDDMGKVCLPMHVRGLELMIEKLQAAAHAGEPQAGLVEGWINVRHDDLPAWNYLILHPTEAHALEVRKISSNTIRTVLVREVVPQSNRQHAGEGKAKTEKEDALIEWMLKINEFNGAPIMWLSRLEHLANEVLAERAPLVGRPKSLD